MSTLGCGGGSTVCARGEVVVGDQCLLACQPGQERDSEGACQVPADVALNGAGFTPEGPKTLSFTGGDGEFSLVDADSSEVVFTATVDATTSSADLPDGVYVGDFSEWTEPGRYFVRVGDADSQPFEISGDVYEPVLEATMLGFYGARCGTEVEFEHGGDTFGHAECHLEDGLLLDGGEMPSVGGWHDAGDYGKYVSNGAFSVGLMLRAWEEFDETLADLSWAIPEAGGDVPDYLDEVRWELDWMLTTQHDDGATSHKVTAFNFEAFILPETDTEERYHAPVGTEATASFAAAMAMASRIYEPFDEQTAADYLDAAQRAQQFLDDNPDYLRPDQSQFSTGGYNSGSDRDERVWALAELWETTGDEALLLRLEEALEAMRGPMNTNAVRSDFDWADMANLGIATYLHSTRSGRSEELVAAYNQFVLERADAMVRFASGHPYGRAFTAYYWGTNGVLARAAIVLQLAFQLTGDQQYRGVIEAQLDHLLGRNPYRRSYLTGVGINPPRAPHHRPSGADGVSLPWPGLLVGGAQPDPLGWIDEQENFTTNEVAINWGAAMAYLVAAVMHESEATLITPAQ